MSQLETLSIKKMSKNDINNNSFEFRKKQVFKDEIDGKNLNLSENLNVDGIGTIENLKVNNLYVTGTPVFEVKDNLEQFPILSSLIAPTFLSFDLYKPLKTITQIDGTINSVDRNWASAALSSSGENISAVVNGGNIWISEDFGENWVEKNLGTDLAWSSISVSFDSMYQTAVVNGGKIWSSSDFGENWTQLDVEQLAWTSVAMSKNGKYQTAVVYAGNIWTSSDFGETWIKIILNSVFPNDVKNFKSVAMNYNGEIQIAVGYSSDIIRSINYGETWAQISGTSKSWSSVCLSYTGQYGLAVSSNGKLYTSNDFGLTWKMPSGSVNSGNRNWFSASMNSTGKYQFAVINFEKQIWKSKDFGKTWILSNVESKSWKFISTNSSGQLSILTDNTKIMTSYCNLILNEITNIV